MPAIKKRKLDHDRAAAVASAPTRERLKNPKAASSPAPTSSPETPSTVPSVAAENPVSTAPSNAPKSFRDLGVIESLCDACANLGYKNPTPIQRKAIPVALSGRDIIGLAETGSGKTAAFAVPMLQALMDKPQPLFGLILAPTRELAYQIAQAFEALGSLIAVRCAVIVGGMDMTPQQIALGKKPHIIVATPGRLMDHLENTKGFSLRTLRYLVLDEADRLLDLDFGPILDKILQVLPRETRRTSLFSATMTAKVDALQRASLRDPVRVQVSDSAHATVATLQQAYLFFPHQHKDRHLVFLLNELAGQRAIVFARTVAETQRLAILLRALGFAALPIHGQLSQAARLGALARFRGQTRDVLVATDVAARGLDLPSVDAVINYDLPPDSKTYVHRVGRTARAGRAGRSFSFVTQYDVELWQRIENALGRQLPEHAVEPDEVALLSERVAEAQRLAVREMRDLHENRGRKGATLIRRRGGSDRAGRGRGGGGGGGGGGRDGMDREER